MSGHDNSHDDTNRTTNRRRFLQSAVATGALTLAGVRPGTARQETCSSFGTFDVGNGDFQLVANDWGSTDEDLCIYTESDGDYGYSWGPRGGDGPPNYPQVLLGTKPWGSDTGVVDFPIRRRDVDQLELTVDIELSISGGEWDLAEEWWLMEQPPGQETGTHVYEIMLVLDWGGGHDHYMEERNVWTDTYGNTVDYWANYDGGGTSADFHIFRVRGGLTNGNVDLGRIVEFMSQRHGVSGDLWMSGIELGNEYWQGSQGEVHYRQFDVTINGTTYTSGSQGGSGGGGGGGGGDQSPYNGPHTLPGRVRAENFDTGGEGTAFQDTTGGNSGGAYRDTDVDIQSCSEGGHNVGWIATDEWLEYTVDVESNGSYDLEARVASAAGGGSFHVEVDGSRVGSVGFGATGGWQSWTTVSLGSADVSAGEHVVRITADDGGWNLNWIEFASDSSGGPIDDGIYRIESVHSGKTLDVAGWSTADGGNVHQWGWTGNANQRWRVESDGDGVYRIESVHSGKVLDIAGGSSENGANLQQWTDGGADNQRFRIQALGGGEYRIEAVHSGKVLDVAGYSTANGGNVHQWGWNGNTNQRWRFEDV